MPGVATGLSADIQERTTAGGRQAMRKGTGLKYHSTDLVERRGGRRKKPNEDSQMTSEPSCNGAKREGNGQSNDGTKGKWECVSSDGREGSLLRKDDIKVGMGER